VNGAIRLCEVGSRLPFFWHPRVSAGDALSLKDDTLFGKMEF
jgi:hypothetical protein